MSRWALCVLLGMLGWSCDDESGAGPECRSNPECPLPQSCIDGRCIEECRRSADCPRGNTCFESVCYAPVAACRADVECVPFGQTCDEVLGRCVDGPAERCHPTLNPCPAGQVCSSGLCQLPGSDARVADAAPRDARVMDAGPRRDAGPMPDAAPIRDAAPAPDMAPDAAPEGMGQYGEDCRCGSQCASGFCVENKLIGRRVCTDGCRDDGECPGLAVCIPVQVSQGTAECPNRPGGPQPGEVVSVCIPNDTGFPCDVNGAQNPCNSGVCLRPPQPAPWIQVQDQCAMFCEDDRKCPHGYSCQRPPGVQRTVCAPAVQVSACPNGTVNECGGVCRVPPGRQEIDLALCLNIDDNNGPGYCSCTCASAADCPQGFACSRADGLDTGDPQRTGICLLMSGYRCAAQAANPDLIQCPSLSCATDDEMPANSACTAQCDREADCPPNHACMPFDGAGSFCIAFE